MANCFFVGVLGWVFAADIWLDIASQVLSRVTKRVTNEQGWVAKLP